MRIHIKRSAALLGAALLFAVQGGAATAAERIGVCGEVMGYTPASTTSDGSVTLGTRTFVLRAGAQAGAQQNARNIARPNFICLEGVRDASGAFTEYLAWPPPFPFCGTVRAYDPPSGAARGRIVLEARATYELPVAAPLTVTVGERACVNLALDLSTRDGIVDRREQRFEHIFAKVAGICGLVSHWTAAEPVPGRAMLVHREAGSITVGTRRYAIAAGTEYSLVNPPPRVGSMTCLAGSLDATGTLVEYGAGPGMPGCTGGAIAEYRAPTAAADGLIHLGAGLSLTPESYRFAISAGTAMPADVTSGRYCFVLAVSAAGDAVVTGARVPEPGRASGPSPTVPGPGIASLPSTSTSRVQAATALRLCGRVTRFEDATASNEGSLSIGTRTYRIAPGGRYLEMHVRMRAGDVRCIRAVLDSGGRLTEFWAYAANADHYRGWPTPPLRDFGLVTQFAPATSTQAGHIGLDDAAVYPVAPGSALPPNVLGHEIGIALELQPDGDAEAVGWSGGASLGAQTGIAAYDGVCGRVIAFVPAAPSAQGSITVGDRNFVIAAGVFLGWGGVLPWHLQPIIGHDVCVSGVRATDGRLISYTITDLFPMNAGVCGDVLETDRLAGRLRLASDTQGMSGWHRIRAGTPLPERFVGRTCFGRAVASDGVAEIVKVQGYAAPTPGSAAPRQPSIAPVAGGGRGAAGSISRLPSTSTTSKPSVGMAASMLLGSCVGIVLAVIRPRGPLGRATRPESL